MKPAYLTTRPGKAGSIRHFWQPSTKLQQTSPFKPVRLSDDPAIAGQQAEAKNRELIIWRSGKKPSATNQVDTFDQLIALFKSSAAFTEKSAATRRTYEYALRIIEKEWRDKRIASQSAATLQNWYQTYNDTPAKRITLARVMRLLFSFARRKGHIAINPAMQPGISYKASKGRLWSPAAVKTFVTTADALGYFEIGTAILLNEWLGQRKADIRRLNTADYQNGVLSATQQKTGAEVMLPVDMVPELKQRLQLQRIRNTAHHPESPCLLPNSQGAVWSESAFDAAFREIRRKAGIGNLVFKDLRHTAVTRLAEAGCDTPLIASITGHSQKHCQDIIDRYNIRTSRQAEEAFKRRLAMEDRDAS